MSSIIRSPKDFCAGLIYLAIGLVAIGLGREMPMGTAIKMGPAYFPTVLGSLLALIGLISLVRSFVQKGEPIPKFAWKPLLFITVATVVFGLLVRGAGFVIALPIFIVMTAYASVHFRWVPTLVIAAVATFLCALVFIKGLGVPLPLIGRWFSSWFGG
jgi:hypothetical protein